MSIGGDFLARYGVVILFVVFFVGIFFPRDYRKWFKEGIDAASKVGRKACSIQRFEARVIRFLGELVLEACSLAFGLSIVVVVGTILYYAALAIFFPLVSQVQTYHDRILELAIIPITGSSVLTGFALAAGGRTTMEPGEAQAVYWVKLFGVLSVMLSLLAVVVDDFPGWRPVTWDILLSLAILALVMQSLVVGRGLLKARDVTSLPS